MKETINLIIENLFKNKDQKISWRLFNIMTNGWAESFYDDYIRQVDVIMEELKDKITAVENVHLKALKKHFTYLRYKKNGVIITKKKKNGKEVVYVNGKKEG